MNAGMDVREILLSASRTLRQNVLKGRIWGAEQSIQSSPVSPSRPLPTPPFANPLYASSSSSVDLSYATTLPQQHNSTDASKNGQKYRNGRVKGMVQSFERSGSFSSECSLEGDMAEERTKVARWLHGEGSVDEQPLRSPSPEGRIPVEPDATAKTEVQQEEPSVEALLATAESIDVHTWGARAWEDMLHGETVKKIVDPPLKPFNLESRDLPSTTTSADLGKGNDSRRGRTREERRIVTAIFAPMDAEKETKLCDVKPIAEREFDSKGVATESDHEEPVSTSHVAIESDSTERFKALEGRETMLQAELVETRSLLEVFRERLEAVEQKLSNLEETDSKRAHEQHRIEELLASANSRAVVPVNNEASANANAITPRNQPLLPNVLRHLRILRGVSSALGRPQAYITDDEERSGPATVSELPSYVLLVGVGVCAVVLQVVLRRLMGRGATAGWKP